jgi:hypothetical protein
MSINCYACPPILTLNLFADTRSCISFVSHSVVLCSRASAEHDSCAYNDLRPIFAGLSRARDDDFSFDIVIRCRRSNWQTETVECVAGLWATVRTFRRLSCRISLSVPPSLCRSGFRIGGRLALPAAIERPSPPARRSWHGRNRMLVAYRCRERIDKGFP